MNCSIDLREPGTFLFHFFFRQGSLVFFLSDVNISYLKKQFGENRVILLVFEELKHGLYLFCRIASTSVFLCMDIGSRTSSHIVSVAVSKVTLKTEVLEPA